MIATLTKLEIDQMLADFVEFVAIHGQANEDNDLELASQCTNRRAEIYRRLKMDGHDSLEAFYALLKHPDLDVRMSAATFGLESAPGESERVLEELATLAPDLTGVNAAMTLFVWRSGELKFPE
jgi:Domain of unknown function (DUF2019)